MKYRKFGKLDWCASTLGFGIMRLPVKDKDYSAIIEEEAVKLVRYGIDNGINYLDTAWNYHRENSEGFLGKALAEGYREKVRIATKMPCWLVEKPEDLDRFFDEQMQRLNVEHIDFYLLHALQRDWWDKMKKFRYLEWAERKMADGLIGHLGFSFHDKFPLFKQIVDDYDNWTMTMVQHNYMDAEKEAGLEGIQYAVDHGLAVIAMEPLRGGQLAKEPPSDVKEIFSRESKDRSPVDWALKWVWDQKNISLILSGMSTLEQLKQNLEAAETSDRGELTDAEHEAVAEVRRAFESRASIGCTDCRYCMPCPQGVAIPFIFDYFNTAKIYDDLRMAKAMYAFLGEDNNAAKCTLCGKCIEHCPQHLSIMNLLKECHALLYTEVEKNEEKQAE